MDLLLGFLLTLLFVSCQADASLGNYSSAAIAIDGEDCAAVGGDVLRRGGSAVDAAVASQICNGVYDSFSMGVGGGFLMTIYIKEEDKVETLIARERAPLKADKDMFHGDADLAQTGGLSMAVPGEVKGLWEAKQKYGNPDISWASLIEPTIEMCRNGITVSKSLGDALEEFKADIFADPGLRGIYVDKKTGKVLKEGDIYTWPNLADTLERIADNGWEEFYHLETAKMLIRDVQSVGSIISLEDLDTYEVEWKPAIQIDFPGMTLHTIPLPGSGAVLSLILNMVETFGLDELQQDPLTVHKIIEAFKFAYGQRSRLGDPFDESIAELEAELVANLTSKDFAKTLAAMIDEDRTYKDPRHYLADYSGPIDGGTSHTSILAPNGDAVAITSTINAEFGSKFMSPLTGIIMNNEMDDFSAPNITNIYGVPPSEQNFIIPGKRPLSSMSPSIFVDQKTKEVILINGASGGTKITTQTALTSMRTLWMGKDILEAIDEPRFHHQLVPIQTKYEEGVPEDVLEGLEERGHILVKSSLAVANAVRRGDDGRIYAAADPRKSGGTDGF